MIYYENQDFEWDDRKAEANARKHGIRFSEAATIWFDGCALEISDPEHSSREERWIRMGYSNQGRLIVAIYCEKNGTKTIRIISARQASRTEEQQYHEVNYENRVRLFESKKK